MIFYNISQHIPSTYQILDAFRQKIQTFDTFRQNLIYPIHSKYIPSSVRQWAKEASLGCILLSRGNSKIMLANVGDLLGFGEIIARRNVQSVKEWCCLRTTAWFKTLWLSSAVLEQLLQPQGDHNFGVSSSQKRRKLIAPL